MNNSNKTHWFKQLFLGLMGSVALTKAVDCIHDEIAKAQFDFSFSNIKIRYLSGQYPRAFILITFALLLYFFLNVVRYYMATYIYEKESARVIHANDELLDETKKRLKGHEDICSEIEKNFKDEKPTFLPTKIWPSIVDIMLSLLVFFLFGIAALDLTNIYFFALIALIILLIDVIHVFHKMLYHGRKMIKIDGQYKNFVRNCIKKIQEKQPELYKKLEFEKLQAIIKPRPPDSKLTLWSWVAIDLLEGACWLWLAWMCQGLGNFFNVGHNHYFYHGCFFYPLAGLFILYVSDLLINRKQWGEVLGVKSV